MTLCSPRSKIKLLFQVMLTHQSQTKNWFTLLHSSPTFFITSSRFIKKHNSYSPPLPPYSFPSMPETSICGLAGDVRVGPTPDPDPNLPPESVRVPIHSIGGVYERDDSAKESTNPKSNNNNNNPNANAKVATGGSRSASQRGTNLKAEGPIIGLPGRIRHVSCSVSRRPPPSSTSSRIFPKKKKAVPESEPTSPKVSCFGKVSSDREQVERKDKRRDPNRRPGWWAHLAAFFLSCACGGGGGGGGGRRRKLLDDDGTEAKSANGKIKSTTPAATRLAAVPAEEPPVPGLGGMKRFASGRRSTAWVSEGEFDIDRDAVLARRSVGSIQEGWRD
ncbi:Uncharacterized protein M6B38_220335 [Iris pallida]|uniref:Uncharacterized protein n=1 Tax=Iris pallida TaxID=29817 RepID=A0AAX6DYD5_IRIPA|nr:Uncharacterized protein M6B38_220335 [Iris pallida]